MSVSGVFIDNLEAIFAPQVYPVSLAISLSRPDDRSGMIGSRAIVVSLNVRTIISIEIPGSIGVSLLLKFSDEHLDRYKLGPDLSAISNAHE